MAVCFCPNRVQIVEIEVSVDLVVGKAIRTFKRWISKQMLHGFGVSLSTGISPPLVSTRLFNRDAEVVEMNGFQHKLEWEQLPEV